MKPAGLKSKLLLAFVSVLIAITGLNVGLAIYLTNRQGEREAFASLTRQTVLLGNALRETVIDLQAVAEKNVAGKDHLSDLSTIYALRQPLTIYPEQAAKYERGLLFNKIISLNRLQVVLQTADFSSAAVYIDNELSHFVTTTEAGMRTIRVDDRPLVKTGKNQAGDLEFGNWPNWAEGDPPLLVTSHITPVDRPTISFDFTADQMVVLQIVVPVQAITQTVMRNVVTDGYPEGILVNDPSIATPETLSQSIPGQNKPVIIGAFVFKKVFDQVFLKEIAEKTGLLPALYSPDGIHHIQIVDMQMDPKDLAQWARAEQTTIDRQMLQRTLEVEKESYYQTLALWQFGHKPRLIVGFAQSAASTSQKVLETVSGLVGVAGLVLLIGGTLGYLLFDRLVKPIRVLTEAVSRIGLGLEQDNPGRPVKPIASDKLVEIHLRASDEVGHLTTAFNAMIQQLRHSFETLEQRVAERTKDLQIAKEQALEVKHAAEAANRAKSTFLANMSHEIRTPLNGVIGMLHLLRGTDQTSEQVDFTDTAAFSASALLNIINDILDFSKIEAGKLDFEIIGFDLRELMEELTEMLELQALKKGLEITCFVEPQTPKQLKGDPGRLRQVLLNLAANALKFTSNGEVNLRATVTEQSATDVIMCFSVTDTGIGIPDSLTDRLFEPFSQGDSSTTREFGGTGLGLAICKKLVELMDGQIGVKRQPDQGSRFWFTARLGCQEPVQHQTDPDGSGDDLENKSILVVDSSPARREILTTYLTAYGCDVKQATGGSEALELIISAADSQRPIDLVMIDADITSTGCEELALSIRAHPQLKATPKVMLVERHRVKARGMARETWFDGIGFKPIKWSGLRNSLLSVLSPRERESSPGDVAEPASQALPGQAGPLRGRILLAEDNPINQKLALHILEKLGYTVDAVATGRSALDALAHQDYDLILMDVQMPEMDGLETTRSIRSRELDYMHISAGAVAGGQKIPERKTLNATADQLIEPPSVRGLQKRIPIIAMTAHAMSGDREKCLAAGMDDYISKPIDPELMATKIAHWLRNEGRQRLDT